MVIMKLRTCVTAIACVLLAVPTFAQEEESGERRIEEMIVTAEKRQSTVSDTSISITAFGEDMLEDLGLQSPDELVNYIPATTRDAYDIRIRGVGRNFRALGGDPGVATYYNGVYSEDFGIAATENGLYDVARVEVLRGPQGTLYGRNAIGGALNYINNEPTFEQEGELRFQTGSYSNREFYGILSGPIIEDTLAYRFTGVKRERDGTQDGVNGYDINSINDANYALALKWIVSENWEMNVRYNDRSSDRRIPDNIIINEGVGPFRGMRDNFSPVYGWRSNLTDYRPNSLQDNDMDPGEVARRTVTASTPGAIAFTDPVTGDIVYGAPARPGLDASTFPYTGNPAFNVDGLRLNDDLGDLRHDVWTNPQQDEKFDQNAVNFSLNWEINETTSIKYIGGWSDFRYTFDDGLDYSPGLHAQYRQTVIEDVHTYSHEIQVLWNLSDNIEVTSGIYNFYSNRFQDYSLTDSSGQGRITDPVNYGSLLGVLGAIGVNLGPATPLGTAPLGTSVSGVWGGDPRGDVYHHQNTVKNTSWAVFSQATWDISDEFSLVLGVRWAEDEKEAFEDRGGYFEFNVDFLGGEVAPFVEVSDLFGVGPATIPGITPLGTMNLLMGNVVPTGNPDLPVVPVCPIDALSCSNPVRLAGVPISYNSVVADEQSWDDVTWRVNLDWTPNDDILMYFSVTTGYRAGGFSLGVTDARDVARDPITGQPLPGAQISPLTYDEETVTAYEIGYKGTHFDGQLQLFASIYRYDYEGYQDRIDAFDAVRNSSVDVVQNAGDALNQGFEVEFTWLATDNLTIGGNYSYTDTEYKDSYLLLDFQNPNIPEGVFGTAISPENIDVFTQDVQGNPLKRIPENKWTIWVNYEWQIESGTITAIAAHSYTGDYQTTAFERRIDLTPDRDRTDISLIYRDNMDKWVVRAFVDNVFDERNLRSLNAGDRGSNYRLTGTLLEPRIYGLDITRRFGGS